MSKSQRILIICLMVLSFLGGLIIYMPAWIVGSLADKYSEHRISTSSEQGTFWNGGAMLMASDSSGKNLVQVTRIKWKVKLGFSNFVDVNFTSSDKTIANVSLSKAGLQVNNVNLILSMDQLEPFLGNLSSMSLSGNVQVDANSLKLGKSNSGIVNVKLEDVGSGISPVNPIGSYTVQLDLANSGIDVSSAPDSVISVKANGSMKGLTLNSTVQADKKDKLLQFMTMMGLPQPDGSYQMKVF